MSEARELFEGLYKELTRLAAYHRPRNGEAGKIIASTLGNVAGATLVAVQGTSEAEGDASEPVLGGEAEPAPDLPDYVSTDGESYAVMLADGEIICFHQACAPEDLDRIAEACRILAARRRAGL